MKSRPMLFSAPMVRAILSGQKTQTRRVVKITHKTPGLAACLLPADPAWARPKTAVELCPYGRPDDRLWVRETFGFACRSCQLDGWRDGVEYRADLDLIGVGGDLPLYPVQFPDGLDGDCYRSGWRPSIHMPRWASRIDLEITGIRVERLQGISEDDARAEGCAPSFEDEIGNVWGQPTYIWGFRKLWESINGTGSWLANPWVWVIEFKNVSK